MLCYLVSDLTVKERALYHYMLIQWLIELGFIWALAGVAVSCRDVYRKWLERGKLPVNHEVQ
jgi:hypothetical protein